MHRERTTHRLPDADFLVREVAGRLAERLLDVNRSFAFAANVGGHVQQVGRALAPRPDIATLVQCDLSPVLAARAAGLACAAEPEALPLRRGAFDLIVSVLSLHWVNDLPGTLIQIRDALKPDGLLLAAFLGGESLRELRQCLMQAEIEVRGGASPRVSPFVEVRDAGGLMQRAGFALPVVDVDRITVTYPHMFGLLSDLRAMGETNALLERERGCTPRRLFLRASEIYLERFASPDGRIPATYDVIFLHGWSPHASQQQPQRPGSAGARLASALDSQEISTGVKPGT